MPTATMQPADRTGPVLGALPVTLAPDRNLLKYYVLSSLLFGPAMVFAAAAFWFRYRTLRYDVDEEGITMRWGILFRREVSLTYARIQDIQLTSNVVERWLGLARIKLQTASGSATAEMTVEGVRDVEAMRDFFYSRMRGVSDSSTPAAGSGTAGAAGRTGVPGLTPAVSPADVAELTATLDAIAGELRALRAHLSRPGRGDGHA